MGFSSQWLILLQSAGSKSMGFSSCGLQTPSKGSVVVTHWVVALWQMGSSWTRDGICVTCIGRWDLPGPGMESVSPALADGIFLDRGWNLCHLYWQMGSSWTRDGICVTCIGRRLLIHCATRRIHNCCSVINLVISYRSVSQPFYFHYFCSPQEPL